ncbi:M48 family metalloprotease [Lentilactobacillus buchneri]|uniref:Peptidase M48 domain-containing protein n=1 Tax=Lentilactobacillus buchneri DSM 20057 TaxID=1423728 RepID=A0A4R5NUX0_LENBU|nr:M48 family metalloprotease [Lentilactobacillus buchneri]WCJ52681.1 M48 family metalloprotease [Lentilactobacillus sp. Egmn17]AEB72460.1 peptidase M48 Ste24p [Lentilactobacillus buchneri NRRL B-30929]KRK66982.1 peptidase M48 Ste24p [Lentilactobacillus buchneri DSM 20057]MCT2883196.1 peptidase M48 Ste24p [Lentilactobacillus buchneri]MCT2898014.1 peptidase M48 Ste24p [Lentilactobacillus buchneri]
MDTINQQVQQNRRRTWSVMAFFVVLIAVIGFLIGLVFAVATQDESIDWLIPTYTMVGFLIGAAIYSFFVYMSVTNILMKSANAHQLQESDDPELFNIVSDLVMVAHIPMPAIYLTDDPSPNAFATGRDPQHAAVAVTKGLREMMNREELEGVLAHEISHIKNYDIRVSSITVALTTFIAGAGTVLIVSGISLIRGGRWFSWFGSDSDDDAKSSWAIAVGILVFGLIMWLGGWIIRAVGVPVAQILQFSVSRERESLADVSGVNLTRDPQGLINALTLLKNDTTPTNNPTAKSAALYINEPVTRQGKTPFLAKMFDTHPPLDERIARLKRLLGEQ